MDRNLRSKILWLALLGVLAWGRGPRAGAADVVLDFEDISLPPESAAPGDASQTPVASQGVVFNRTWDSEFDCCPGGWAPSNQTDLTTAGFGNPFSAYNPPTGGGNRGSSNFLVGFDSTGADAEIEFPVPTTVRGMFVANTTYAYLAVKDGDDGAGFVKGPFAEDDFFKLNVIGLDAGGRSTGNVELFLADFLDGESEILSSWTWLDLSPLGDQVARLSFELSSSDVGMFGMNTPAYFAIDDLTLAAVPEPWGGCLAWCGAAVMLRQARRTAKQRQDPRRA